MSASKSRPKSSKTAKTIQLWCQLIDSDAGVWYISEAMRHKKALETMACVVDEMRAIMGRGKIGQRASEPQWLTDAVDAKMGKIRAALRTHGCVDIDDE